MRRPDNIKHIILEYFPNIQAVYLFGSFDSDYEREDSDIDIGLLFPPETANPGIVAMNKCRYALADYTQKDVDLINMRQVSTVFQKEIIANGRLLFCLNQYAVDEFEMLVLSYYQKLNQERKDLLEDFKQTGRAYNV